MKTYSVRVTVELIEWDENTDAGCETIRSASLDSKQITEHSDAITEFYVQLAKTEIKEKA
jgi:hypothetical protein